MRKLTLSTLAVLFIFSLTTVFVSCGDEEKTDETTTDELTEEVLPEETVVADYSAGADVYAKTCQACHQANGEGIEGSFPSLKGKTADISMIVNGKEGTAMLAYKNTYSDQELADVINFINHSWENNFDDITVVDIAAVK